MRITLLVTVDVDEHDFECEQEGPGHDIKQVLADEVESNLESLGYVVQARVDRYLVPKLAEHLDGDRPASFIDAAGALVQWTRMEAVD
jgi:hypothetical protein